VVKALAGSDRVKVEVVHAGGVEMVFDAMRQHQRNAAVCEAGCAAIAALVLRFPDHCDAVIGAGGPEVICTTLELHQSSAAVQVLELDLAFMSHYLVTDIDMVHVLFVALTQRTRYL